MGVKRVTKEQRDRVLELHLQGMPNAEISKQLGLRPKQVGAVVKTAQNAGRIPTNSPTAPPPSVPPLAPPVPSVQASLGSAPAADVQPHQVDDGQSWKAMPAGIGGAYAPQGYALYYQVERVEPTRDGVLRKFNYSPSDDEIGRTYGSGVYWVTKHEGSRPVVYREVRISSAYGATRTPRAYDAQPGSAPDRPSYTPRMFERIRSMRGAVDEDDVATRPPYYRRPYLERPPYREREEDSERSALSEFGRHRSTDEGIAVAAVQQLGKLHELTLKQRESESKSGPQALITNFFEKQQTLSEQQRSQERKRDEQRLEEERRRQEEQRKEEDRRWERRQEELAAQHKREMERLEKEAQSREKAERDRSQGLLELYDKRMQLAEHEARNREQRLKDELDRARQDAKEDREKLMAKLTEMSQQSEQRIAEMQEEIKEELEKERNNLTQHHTIKMKALENEHTLRQEMLKLREDMIKNQSSDGVEKMLGKLAEGLERTVKEVVDLKKIQAVGGLSPEAQAAHVVQGTDGSSQGVTEQPTVSPPKVAPPQQSYPGNGAEAGNGASPAPQEAVNMESEVVANMQKPFFQEVLKEWALHVQSGNDATAFANMFMEWMRDDSTPEAAAARKACGGFTTFISVRNWAQVLNVLRPALPQGQMSVFESGDAEVFYETFKTMVVESVRDYWKSYLVAKQAEREALQQQRRAAAPPEETQKASA